MPICKCGKAKVPDGNFYSGYVCPDWPNCAAVEPEPQPLKPLTSVEVDGRRVEVEYTGMPIVGGYQADTDLIILSRDLLNKPKLHEYVVVHEKRHALARHKVMKNSMIDASEAWGHITNEEFIAFQAEQRDKRKKTRARLRYSKPLILLFSIFLYPLLIYYAIRNSKQASTPSVGMMLIVNAIANFVLFTFMLFCLVWVWTHDGNERYFIVFNLMCILVIVKFTDLIHTVGKDLRRKQLDTT